ncbi:hypothetical protein Ctob_010126 [Chrysochromulina tobinii]|uniref:Uncharacterized protein n=1 Tax=Chrysochromulina tobinii TaxID=1460289 RepID=A0A0M0KST0_9EUKA|nr:hypothetical protein Ctob_010126 [Chrysochromulina tobinii]|eukprot:KOO41876.1 hypothetical protein Ctob_010126 [Chrysochromulina sp. CCMP291]
MLGVGSGLHPHPCVSRLHSAAASCSSENDRRNTPLVTSPLECSAREFVGESGRGTAPHMRKTTSSSCSGPSPAEDSLAVEFLWMEARLVGERLVSKAPSAVTGARSGGVVGGSRFNQRPPSSGINWGAYWCGLTAPVPRRSASNRAAATTSNRSASNRSKATRSRSFATRRSASTSSNVPSRLSAPDPSDPSKPSWPFGAIEGGIEGCVGARLRGDVGVHT